MYGYTRRDKDVHRRNRINTERFIETMPSFEDYDESERGIMSRIVNAFKSLGSRSQDRQKHSYNILRVQPTKMDDMDECWDECVKCIQRKRILIFVATAMKREDAQRVLDSLCGAVLCGRGHVEVIGERVYLFCPSRCSVNSVGMSLPSTHNSSNFHYIT